ncbi:MAG: type II secretion system F family protein, partial [Planctomycetaceae bacterium]|nr:type II secretion system F family protein [Planctomycetaceae bacterium]
QLLGLLVEQQLPLPQALRLTGAGLDDPSLRAAALQVAGEVERGASLSSAIASQRRFAPTLSPWLAASERASALAGGLKTAAELFQARVQSQIELLKIVLPPIMLVVVGWGVTFVAVALIYPAVSLIRDLTF